MLVRIILTIKNKINNHQRTGKSMKMKAKKIRSIPPPCLEGAVCTE